ncbi:LysE family translocator [Paracoccus sp. p4-l81]|uniref:LysE family translocator n=1 Tax=Paracoccus sp. p4-l81 TaxID=3342806 RepID=UPI0035BA58C5
MSLAILSPGPAIISAIQMAFAHGRDKALRYGLGLAFGASLWGLFSLAGLAVVFRIYPALFHGMKILGGLYLLWMAWGLWSTARDALPAPAQMRFGSGFVGGVALNLSNPKPALFYASLILTLFPGHLSLARQASIYLTALSTEVFWFVVVTVSMSTAVMRVRYFAAKFWIDRATAVALAALGLVLMLG